MPKKKIQRAPSAPKRERPEPVKSERVPPKAEGAVKRAEPVDPNLERLKKLLEETRDALLKERKRAGELGASVDSLKAERDLLAAGMDPDWTDEKVVHAFTEAKMDSGVLGACLHLLRGQREQAYSNAEILEERGELNRVPGAVSAARRIRAVEEELVRLFTEASGLGEMDPQPRRASRYR